MWNNVWKKRMEAIILPKERPCVLFMSINYFSFGVNWAGKSQMQVSRIV